MLSRDSEIAPTGTLYHYFQSTLYIKIRKQVMLGVLGISNLNWITMGVLPLRVFLHYTLYLSQSQSELVVLGV